VQAKASTTAVSPAASAAHPPKATRPDEQAEEGKAETAAGNAFGDDEPAEEESAEQTDDEAQEAAATSAEREAAHAVGEAEEEDGAKEASEAEKLPGEDD
jgi:hypothetical protein